jgi:hypothetical protein
MEDWVESAISQWRQEELEINPPAPIKSIKNAESILNFRFPPDFKGLYLSVNGFVNFEQRGFMLSLWSIERIVDDYDPAKKFIMFSDYSLSVCQYGFDRNKTGIFKAYTHHQQGPVQFVAESFKELIRLFNDDGEILF